LEDDVNDHLDFLEYLYVRWQDEKQYEDIADYLKAMQERVPQAFKITKDPFAIYFHGEDQDMHVTISVAENRLKFAYNTNG